MGRRGSVTLAGRMQRKLLRELGKEQLEVNAEGELLGGELLPKSISALKQALREQLKA
jgi:hypothetical protein